MFRTHNSGQKVNGGISHMSKILLVEDDYALAYQVETYLCGLSHTVDVAHCYRRALDFLSVSEYDLLILDRTLPDGDAIDLAKGVRTQGLSCSVIFLTGKNALNDKLAAFESGADDYLTKPFQLKELGARVVALLRRSSHSPKTELICGELSVNYESRIVCVLDVAISLTKTEFVLLELLVRNPNQYFSSEALLSRVWSAESEATEEAVKSTVKRLRQKLGDSARYIKSQRGFGYMFSPSSHSISQTAPESLMSAKD